MPFHAYRHVPDAGKRNRLLKFSDDEEVGRPLRNCVPNCGYPPPDMTATLILAMSFIMSSAMSGSSGDFNGASVPSKSKMIRS